MHLRISQSQLPITCSISLVHLEEVIRKLTAFAFSFHWLQFKFHFIHLFENALYLENTLRLGDLEAIKSSVFLLKIPLLLGFISIGNTFSYVKIFSSFHERIHSFRRKCKKQSDIMDRRIITYNTINKKYPWDHFTKYPSWSPL